MPYFLISMFLSRAHEILDSSLREGENRRREGKREEVRVRERERERKEERKKERAESAGKG